MLRHTRFLLRQERAMPKRWYATQPETEQFDLQERTRERGQRLFYHDTIRSSSRYNSSKIVIQPTIRHLLVKLLDKNHHSVNLANGLKSDLRPEDTLEPLMFHILLVLQTLSSGLTESSQLKEQLQHIQQAINVRQFPQHDLIEKEVQAQVNDDIECLLNLTGTPIPPLEDEIVTVLRECVVSFAIVSRLITIHRIPSKQRKRLLNQGLPISPQYSVRNDLIPWILSLSATSISKSCEAITNLTNIPPFVTSNILLRSPTSANELYLQLDIWSTFQGDILKAYFKKPTYLVDIIENLLFYSVLYDCSKTPEIFTTTLEFMATNEANQINFKFLSPKLINRLIWQVVFNYFRSVLSSHHHDSSNIIQTQEILVSFLSHRRIVGEDTDCHKHLDLEGHMGIVLAIKYLSPAKSEKLFDIADQKFIRNQNLHNIPKQELSQYLCTKIVLLKTAEELVHNFNTAVLEYPNKSFLWLALIKKLIEFDLLTTARSMKILDQLVAQTDTILITKDIIQHLLVPIQSLDDINRVITTLLHERGPSKSPLFSSLSSYIFPKYLSILYKYPDTISPVNFLDVWPRKGEVPVPSELPNVEVARYMFKHCVQRKTSNLVGIMLNGEAKYDPQNVYSLYNAEFDGPSMPDELCLVALLTASMRTDPVTKTYIMWGNYYAPQVSIREFKKHVAAKSKQVQDLDSANIFPSARLWQAYIGVLAKFDYTGELADIIQWWEGLHYKPNAKTLLMLLGSLPEQFGDRYILHNEKVNHDRHAAAAVNVNDWPWPAIEELRAYRKHKRLFM